MDISEQKSRRKLLRLVIFVMLSAIVTAWVAVGHAATRASAPALLVAPTVKATGSRTLRRLVLSSVTRSIRAMMAFSLSLRVLGDDAKADVPKAVLAARLSNAQRQLEKADALAQRARQLAAGNYHTRAVKVLLAAIERYEKHWRIIADFSKLADAYRQVAISGWYAHKGAATSQRFLRKALTLRPTLVVDRRHMAPGLVALVDRVGLEMRRRSKRALSVRGDMREVCVHINGRKVGPLPAGRAGLAPGVHYVQVLRQGRVVRAHRMRITNGDVALVVSRRGRGRVTEPPTKPRRRWTTRDVVTCGSRAHARHPPCRRKMAALTQQTGADLLLFPSLMTTTSGRLRLQTWLVNPRTGTSRAQPPLTLAADLGDIHAQLANLQQHVAVDAHQLHRRQ